MHRSVRQLPFTAASSVCLFALLVVASPAGQGTASRGRPPAPDVDFLFALVDGNHDSVIDRQEFAAFSATQWKLLDPQDTGSVTAQAIAADPRATTIARDLVPSGAGLLSRQAFVDGYRKRFEQADTDHDGTLDTGEFAAFLGLKPPVRTTSQAAATQLPSLARPFAAGLPLCADLGTDATGGLARHKGISSLLAKVVPANSKDAAYCLVQFVYNSGRSGPKDGYDDGQSQAITIRVGLPLRPDNGGTVAWNGRIQNVGSGGCMGNLPSVTVATNAGFASASTDGGHGAPWIAFNCGFGVIQSKHELNKGLIRDFSAEHVRWQTMWSKALVKAYYGQPAQRTYWCGCSQGGREGLIALQTIPQEYDGILAGASALYWMRFQMAQAWSGVVIKDLLRSKGKDLTPAQIQQTVQLEVAGCDVNDGLKDGELADPRRCHWSAKAAICGNPGTQPGACLDADQAQAFDVIRRGPRNHLGQRIWFPWEPGTTFSNQSNYLLSDSVMQWTVRDLTFQSDQHLYMDKASLLRAKDPQGITYEDMATLASQRVSDLADMDNAAIDAAEKSGVKVIAWTGTADRNIQSRNTIQYYRDVAAHLGMKVSDTNLQSWFRVFLYPDVDHCAGGSGPQPGSVTSGPLFAALVNWVEQNAAPERIIATKVDAAGRVTRTRPVCAYPQTALYRGRGSIDDAASFRCGGDLETPEIVSADRLALHKKENGSGDVPTLYGDK